LPHLRSADRKSLLLGTALATLPSHTPSLRLPRAARAQSA